MKMKMIGTLIIALLFVTASSPIFSSDCKTKDFKTELAKKACGKGGVKAAKKAWKDWVSEVKDAGKKIEGKKPSCKSCHKDTKKYDQKIKPKAADWFKELGGK